VAETLLALDRGRAGELDARVSYALSVDADAVEIRVLGCLLEKQRTQVPLGEVSASSCCGGQDGSTGGGGSCC